MLELTGAVDLVLQIMMAGAPVLLVLWPYWLMRLSSYGLEIYRRLLLQGSQRDLRRHEASVLASPELTLSSAWINLRNYPFISNKTEYRRDTIVVKEVMTPVKDLCLLSDEGWTFSRLGTSSRAAHLAPELTLVPSAEALLETEEFRGYPIVRTLSDRVVLGYISKLELQSAMGAPSLPRSHRRPR